ncbi:MULTISPECIES: filamentous hemagglutinin N-terminal domain-containing protein [Nostoc]|uniref:Filamentous hemagglutinin N-terminal domain-containing protein n=1 Tax=Nostoc paludosum FACHB-159 TaxID=2692908 RepID=A0ABR8K4K4_9NOSO|nr:MULTISPECIES: filamentous hemagglutinin N-terminal domain-containing protein [Nostoc]MBD2677114.1 filamentous hemagglutinin N-terminal domain-containing protein [Nostoc sp. FACHB-857]MBD2733313.1 filamentous hemagglutinin N-terminal domain-containing protein [Nostoc paludosum FACHB-159]
MQLKFIIKISQKALQTRFNLLGCVGLQILFFSNCAFAQSNIIPDNTLGSDRSVVTPLDTTNNLPVDLINGGAVRGINLFHSFQEFNVSEGRAAYFLINNSDIQNVLTRVTGKNPSEIFGTLGIISDSNPNLFLINPNGIIFGPNATLDVGGSFVATTANGVNLGQTGIFNASEPAKSNLLSVQPSALFFNAVNNQAEIINNSRASSTVLGSVLNGNPQRQISGLTVLDGKDLSLIGGNVTLDGGFIFAPGGRVELAGLTEPGIINLDTTGWRFPDNVARADVSLKNAAAVFIVSGDRGSIAVNARNFSLDGGSRLTVLNEGLGNINSSAGNIEITATDNVTLQGTSSAYSTIFNVIENGEKAGDIIIKAANLEIIGDAAIGTFTLEKGNAGNIDIQARDKVTILGTGATTSISSYIETGAEGKGGNINIQTKSFVLDNAQVGANSLGNGNAGNIQINAAESFSVKNAQIGSSNFGKGDAGNLTIEAEKADIIFDSSLISSTAGGSLLSETITSGQAGDILIKGRSLSATNNIIQTSTVGQGNAGNITLDIQDNVSFTNSFIFGVVAQSATGQGGNVTIKSGSLSLNDGSEVNVSTAGKGDGGKIFINTDLLELTNNSFIGSNAFGEGNAGNISIEAKDKISILGNDNDSQSGISSSVDQLSVGNGGDIDLQTNSLLLNNGIIGASNFAAGKAGNIRINVTDLISASGDSQIGTFSTGQGDAGNIIIEAKNAPVYFDGTFVQSVAAFNLEGVVGGGKGGDITIKARSLSLSNNAYLQSSAFGQGNGGNIFVEVQDDISLSNSFIDSGVVDTATGKGGDINIQADSLFLTDNSFVNSSSTGKGNPGNISINLRNTLRSNNSTIGTASTQSSGGAINITAQDIRLRGDSDIRTNVLTGAGGGGNITLTAGTIIALEDSDILAFASDGRGGDITFNTQAFLSSPLYRPQAQTGDRANLRTELEGNNRADINASGAIFGNIIGVPDITFIQNSITELQDNPIDSNALIANSCIARSPKQEGTFFITGVGGLPIRPGNASASNYPTGNVQNISNNSATHHWEKGDSIIEPQGIYRLANGQLIMSRECP